MKPVEQRQLTFDAHGDVAWRSWASVVNNWLTGNKAEPREAIVLLPFVALIAPARQALARQGGWLPRIETTRTLTASLLPTLPVPTASLSGDVVGDRLFAGELLRRQAWAVNWAAADRRAFDQGIVALVDAAQGFAEAAAALAPAHREAWWRRARSSLVRTSAVGERESALAMIALEWAASLPPPGSDVMFDLKPSAWIVFAVGGVDALATGVVHDAARSGIAGLLLCADSPGDPFDIVSAALDGHGRGEGHSSPHIEMPTLLIANDAEQEAMAAATTVIAALNDRADDDPRPVALIAEDRQIIRRIRALLARHGLQIADETGWALSTSRAGAHLMALLRALAPQAGADLRLDALKAEQGDDELAALIDLESLWRSGGVTPSDPLRREAANRYWAQTQARWAALAGSASQTLTVWLSALANHLRTGARAQWWQDDAAGRAVWLALRLGDDQAFAHSEARIDRAEFTAWVASVLESSVFADASADVAAQVVVTPLARALWRPFFAVVVPGADSQHLGPPAPSPALLDDALLRELGMLDRATRARRTAQAFVQLLLAPRLTLLRRRSDGDEMQEASPLVDRLALALPAARRSDWRDQAAELGTERKAPTPVARPQPQAAAALPARLSASQVEALRDCPYRFFATAVLRLRSVDELDADADKRLYGNWLHATLKYFHEHRADLDPVPDTAAAQADFIAAAESAMAGLKMSDDPADAERLRVDLLPFRVGLEALAQRYLEWLAGHEAKSWRFSGGEIDRRIIPVVMGGTALVGRLDRIDSHSPAADAAPVADIPAPRASLRQVAPAARSWLLIDYKTGSAEALKRKVRQPLEDTQLAFYAAISAPALAEGDTLAALYLALDDRDEVKAIVHPDVGESAQALLDGLADEWHRLRAGAAMPALGEGPICEFCDARGLCRRDRWGPA